MRFLLVLLSILSAQADQALPTQRTVSWAGWGAGSTLVCKQTTQSWTNPAPYEEMDTWTVAANDGKTVTGTKQIAVPGLELRNYAFSEPVVSTVVFQPTAQGTNPTSNAAPPEQALGYEDIAVPAGSFPRALKTGSAQTIIDADSTSTSWWADGVPLAVKTVAVGHAKGGETTTTTVLMSMSRVPPR